MQTVSYTHLDVYKRQKQPAPPEEQPEKPSQTKDMTIQEMLRVMMEGNQSLSKKMEGMNKKMDSIKEDKQSLSKKMEGMNKNIEENSKKMEERMGGKLEGLKDDNLNI